MISFYLWLCVIILLFLGISLKLKDDVFDKIPGPPGLFLLDNSLDFLMDSVKTFRYFTMLCNKYTNMFKLKVGMKKIVILYNPEDVETLISGTKYNKKGFVYDFIQPWLQDGLLLSHGKKWHERRKILTPAFHFKVLRNFNVTLIENTEKLVQQIEREITKPKTDIMDLVTDFTLKSICETAMGTKLDEETSEFGKTYKKSVHDLGTIVVHRAQRIWMYSSFLFNISHCGKYQKNIIDMISNFRDKVVKQRREEMNYSQNIQTISDTDNEEDLLHIYGKKRLAMLDLLLDAEKRGYIDKKGINEEVDTFMFEGHDTTATALQFAFMILANKPEIQDKIAEETNNILGTSQRLPDMNELSQMKYLECCIKESLRMYPPVFFISRKIEEPITLRNYECPAGTDVTVLIRELHHSHKQFRDPFEFKPERFMGEPTWHPFAYIPFSAGPRNCIGQKFAMMEMKLALSTVLRHYRVLPITKPEDIVYITDFILRPNEPIYVKFEKRIS